MSREWRTSKSSPLEFTITTPKIYPSHSKKVFKILIDLSYISESRLHFRVGIAEPDYEQNDDKGVTEVS